MKSPLPEVTVSRAPCRFGDFAATVTPGSGSPWASDTCPEIVPVVLCAPAETGARIRQTTANQTLTRMWTSPYARVRRRTFWVRRTLAPRGSHRSTLAPHRQLISGGRHGLVSAAPDR